MRGQCFRERSLARLKVLRFSVDGGAFLGLQIAYSSTISYLALRHRARSCASWFSGFWPLSSVETRA